jgi:pyruvate dehydrogenase phosphatase
LVRRSNSFSGWATSATLKERLVPYVSRSLSALFTSSSSPPTQTAVEEAIATSFITLDNEILTDGITALRTALFNTEAQSRLAPAISGSCALLSIYDPNTSLLHTACTGDSRAVLGCLDPSPRKYTAVPLSTDQTGFNALELARVRAAHPGESDAFGPETGRTFGIAVTRAFGYGLWKWPADCVKECYEKFFHRAPGPGYKTPPYLIVDPVVTTTKIKGRGSFVILACNGLWEHISSEQAVRLVEMWITKKEGRIGKVGVGKEAAVGVEPSKIGEKRLARGLSDEEKVKEDNFVVEDNNVATHLVRNAPGGADHEMLCGLTGIQPPLSRNARDDITVQVIFFEDKA